MKPLRVLAVLQVLTPAAALTRQIEALALEGEWTTTDPPVNLVHIDLGEINREGQAVGYHHRPNGTDPDSARVLEIIQPPDPNGVYRARVSIRDGVTGAWVRKRVPSTFFPDGMSDPDVVNAVLTAFRDGHRRNDGQFVGPSGRKFMIEGWYQKGRINAAYPLLSP